MKPKLVLVTFALALAACGYNQPRTSTPRVPMADRPEAFPVAAAGYVPAPPKIDEAIRADLEFTIFCGGIELSDILVRRSSAPDVYSFKTEYVEWEEDSDRYIAYDAKGKVDMRNGHAEVTVLEPIRSAARPASSPPIRRTLAVPHRPSQHHRLRSRRVARPQQPPAMS